MVRVSSRSGRVGRKERGGLRTKLANHDRKSRVADIGGLTVETTGGLRFFHEIVNAETVGGKKESSEL